MFVAGVNFVPCNVRPQLLSPFASATLKTTEPHDDRRLKFHIMTIFTNTRLYDRCCI